MAGKATLEDAVVYSTGGDHHVADTGLLLVQSSVCWPVT